MSEFSATAEDRVSPVVSEPSSPSAGHGVWRRPIIVGLSLPLLIGVVLIVMGAGWYLFAPDSTPSVNQLAFREDHDEQPITTEGTGTKPQLLTTSNAGGSQFKDEVAAMIGGVRSYAETNRTAIGRLSETVKSQGAGMTFQQQQLTEAQAQLSVLSARLSSLEGRPAAQASTQRAAKPAARVRSPLSGMRVEAVQNGMAWVYWQDRTWAVKAGDQVGTVTVTGIDAQTREVHTSAGTLR
ncbi:conjugal transfer protein TraP [Pseudomonas fluorescens]|uniref:conjugal transfer protein TraP n=1 Tax=Pseudomonas fluorescens TaxID=294 RepID=UPI001BE5BE56|nr:conjugal transfer protein TraP [Pseudomonas fluorescens]MBT2375551.1 conjugal transfer protein TraP [Pseudomonas fluorescens]